MIVRALIFCLLPAFASAQTINVGSKRFTESYILGEILAQTMQQTGEARAVYSGEWLEAF